MFNEPKVLHGCGHTFCGACLNKIGSSNYGKITCPQGHHVNSGFSTNFALKNALEYMQQSFSIDEKEAHGNDTLVTHCVHAGFVKDGKLEMCAHCNLKFCPPCLLSHKVLLRMEASITASHVRFLIEYLFFIFVVFGLVQTSI